MAVYFRCEVQQEAIEFIKIWQTSKTRNEVFKRLEDSPIWRARVKRLGDRYDPYSGYRASHSRSAIDMSTKVLAKRFHAQLLYQYNITALDTWGSKAWVCANDALDLKAFAQALADDPSLSIDIAC